VSLFNVYQLETGLKSNGNGLTLTGSYVLFVFLFVCVESLGSIVGGPDDIAGGFVRLLGFVDQSNELPFRSENK
jgi:hypothetical protein